MANTSTRSTKQNSVKIRSRGQKHPLALTLVPNLGSRAIAIIHIKRYARFSSPLNITQRCSCVLSLQLLTRFYVSLHASNPSLLTSAGKRYTIAPPQILREGVRRSIFANVADICKRMHRSPEHVIQFLFAEMGTTGSVDGSGRLVIKGRFQPKQVENVLRRYIGQLYPRIKFRRLTRSLVLFLFFVVEYVTCKTCKSPDTLLTKENRIFFMSCESCGSRRSVNAIKSGFQAQVGKRSKNKTG